MLYKEVAFKNIAARNLILAEYISEINDTLTPLGGKINRGAIQTPVVQKIISSSINPHTIKQNIETKLEISPSEPPFDRKKLPPANIA